MLDWHAEGEDMDRKKRKKSRSKKPSASEIAQNAYSAQATPGDLRTPDAATELLEGPKVKADGEQLEDSMPAEPAAQSAAQPSLLASDAAAEDVNAGALPTNTEGEEMRPKQKKRQQEGESRPTHSQLELAGLSQSPSVPLSSKVQPSKSVTILVSYCRSYF